MTRRKRIDAATIDGWTLVVYDDGSAALTRAGQVKLKGFWTGAKGGTSIEAAPEGAA